MIPRRNTSHHSLASLVIAPDDHDILRQVRLILDEHPRKGPPDGPSELCPYIYMGSLKNANDVSTLQSLGITHVLNCAGNSNFQLSRSPYSLGSGIMGYYTISADDHAEYDIMRHFDEAFQFLDSCRKAGGKALVHCNLGINRSGAICAAYLMADQRMSLLQVISLLKRKRSLVLCNKGFRRQLIRFARSHGYLEAASKGTKTFSEYTDYNGFGVDRTNCIDFSHTRMSNGVKPFTRSASANDSDSRMDTRKYPRSKSACNGDFENKMHTLQLPKTVYNSKTRGPDRFSREYRSLPRVGSQSNGISTRKRPTNASHYDNDYFMDTIHEDGRFANGDVKPHNKEKIAKGPQRNISPFGGRAFMNFRRSKSKSTDRLAGVSLSNSMEEDSVLSSTRPLRVYKRAVTDSELYEKPAHQYKRADTVATTDIAAGLGRMKIKDKSRQNDTLSGLSEQHRSASKLSLSSNFFSKLKTDIWKKSSRSSLNS